MPTKLALFAAVAIVFAPGWGASDAGAGRHAVSDLAGRILAPTVHESSAQPQSKAGFQKRVEVAPSGGVGKLAASSASRGDQLALGAALAVLAAAGLFATGGLTSDRSQRAPPGSVIV